MIMAEKNTKTQQYKTWHNRTGLITATESRQEIWLSARPRMLSEHTSSQYELKETTMYPTLYRLNQNGYLDSEQVKVGEKTELASIII